MKIKAITICGSMTIIKRAFTVFVQKGFGENNLPYFFIFSRIKA